MRRGVNLGASVGMGETSAPITRGLRGVGSIDTICPMTLGAGSFTAGSAEVTDHGVEVAAEAAAHGVERCLALVVDHDRTHLHADELAELRAEVDVEQRFTLGVHDVRLCILHVGESQASGLRVNHGDQRDFAVLTGDLGDLARVYHDVFVHAFSVAVGGIRGVHQRTIADRERAVSLLCERALLLACDHARHVVGRQDLLESGDGCGVVALADAMERMEVQVSLAVPGQLDGELFVLDEVQGQLGSSFTGLGQIQGKCGHKCLSLVTTG